MTENGIKIKLLDSDEKNASFVLALLKDRSYSFAGLPVSPSVENVKSMLVDKKILSMEKQNGEGADYFGIAVPCMIDELNEFGLYGILFDKNTVCERPQTIAVSIRHLKDYLFCQKLTKIGILLPQSPEMIEVMTKIRRYGFKREAIWRSYFKTSAGFIDGVLLDNTADDRKTIISDISTAQSSLMPEKDVVVSIAEPMLDPEKMPETEIEPEAAIEKKAPAIPEKDISAVIKPAEPIVAAVKSAEPIPSGDIGDKAKIKKEKEIIPEKLKEFMDTVDTICLKYGFGQVQKSILIGLMNSPGNVLKTGEIKRLKGLEKTSGSTLMSYLYDLQNNKAIKIEGSVIILKI